MTALGTYDIDRCPVDGEASHRRDHRVRRGAACFRRLRATPRSIPDSGTGETLCTVKVTDANGNIPSNVGRWTLMTTIDTN